MGVNTPNPRAAMRQLQCVREPVVRLHELGDVLGDGALQEQLA